MTKMFSLVHLLVEKILGNAFVKPPGWNNNEGNTAQPTDKELYLLPVFQLHLHCHIHVSVQVGYLTSPHHNNHIWETEVLFSQNI